MTQEERNKIEGRIVDVLKTVYDPEIPVNQNDPAIVNIRQQLQLAVYHLRAGVVKIILLDQEIAQNATLPFNGGAAVCDGPAFIIVDDGHPHNDRRYNSQYDQNDQDTEAQTLKKVCTFPFFHQAWK